MQQTTESDDLFLIKKQFMCCLPVKQIKWQKFFQDCTLQQQEQLIKYTINNPTVQKYPIKINYQRLFLKSVIDILEKQGSDISDCVYEAFGQLVTLPTTIFHYKHFIFENKKPIIIKESTSIISEGTTGLSIWEASLVLSQWCLVNKELFAFKNILELGAGLGLAGLVSLNFCNFKELTLSDCHPQVLNLLCENVQLNIKNNFEMIHTDNENFSEKTSNKVLLQLKNSVQTVKVLKLFWEEIDETFCKNISLDYVLAADIVYDSSLFPSLARALKLLVHHCKAKVIFVYTERNMETFMEFLKQILANSLSLVELQVPTQKEFFWPQNVPIKIFTIVADMMTEG